MAEKTKKRLEEAAQSGSTEGIIDPPSPIRRHVKWKMARTKKTGQMTFEAAKEIADRIDSLDEQASQGSFVPHGRQDILTAAIGRPEHPGRVRAIGAAVSPTKPPESPDEEVDDPLYLMTLTIPQLFLKPLQVMWDATIFGVFNQNFPFVRAGNSDVYGFLEPQSIQRSGQSQFESESYIKSWIQSSKRDVYLGAYLNSGHWQMVVILPKENLVVWFCSLHNRPDNYLKGIINSALKGLDDTPQPKSKAAARQKGITECGYYVMHCMSTIILGSFRNNWETYFNEVRPLEAERFKALRIQWAQYYLKVRNQT
ncbi:hypothetical protein GmHk_01G000874 [Glycine max]|nr:hypothetical protein GmHk_01G000874 [Glycine max]